MRLYCDTHVHCYDFIEFERLLDAAHQNLSQQAQFDNVTEQVNYLVFFTDGKTDRSWPKILDAAKHPIEGAKWLLSVDETSGLVYASNANRVLLLAPGRQLNSAERLEFLVLGCDQAVENGTSAAEIIEKNQQYVVICPWGVGKWLGARGKILSELILRFDQNLILGDNGCRPKFWRTVRQFGETSNPIINGSDPLPIKGEIGRVGQFGVAFDVENERPNLATILQHLKSAAVMKQNFGSRQSFWLFARSRWALLIRGSLTPG